MLDQSRVRAFYDFMVERESIRLRRLAGLPRDQWTQDEIFKTFSFTNVKREHDRTTVAFRRLYEDQIHACPLTDIQNKADLLISCAVFRFFGTIHSANVLGTYSWARCDGRYGAEYVEELRNYGMQGDLTFTSAYIVSGAGRSCPKYEVVAEVIEGLIPQAQNVVAQLELDGWQAATYVLTRLFGFGSFMAKEVLLDYILVSKFVPRDWSTWTPVGPGGKRGAARIKYGELIKIGEDEALEVIQEVYAARSEYWPKLFTEYHDGVVATAVESVTLDLTDIQFQMCEFDKYSRVAEGRCPKRLFRPTVDEVTCRS